MTTTLPTSFHESLRYLYPLDRHSLVIDCGGFKGEFALEMFRRYACRLIVFEPIKQFYEDLALTLHGTGATIVHSGVGVRDEDVHFKVHGSMSGPFADGGIQQVHLIDFPDFLTTLPIVDLLKLNIEGGEYDLLDAMLARGSMARIANLQVQFHRVVDDYEKRHAAIREQLLTTHHLTYDFDYCWSNYAINT